MRSRVAVTTLAVVLGLGAAACGSDREPRSDPSTSPSVAPASTTWAEGSWLLRFNTAGGAEGEAVGAVYVRFTPSTGAVTVRRLPAVSSRDTYSDAQALMVSADQALALLDSRVTKADSAAGRVTLYPTTPGAKVSLDLRALTGVADLRPRGAAFDPVEPELLRVVDTARRVWKVDVVARTAVRDGSLPVKAGWIFANGFDKNTGLPFIESLDTAETLPAGNGDDDVRPVLRRGGEIFNGANGPLPGQPAFPCGFASGFRDEDGTAWLFCADTPQVQAYRSADGSGSWDKVGVASEPVVPATAEELPVVLPPPAVE